MTIHNPLGFVAGSFLGSLLDKALERPIEREEPQAEPGEMMPPTKHVAASGLDIVDMRALAAKAKYRNGRNKRDAYRRVDLSTRRVVAVKHQMGCLWAEDSPSYARVTAHFVVLPSGTVLRNYDLDVRLICSNMLDVRPYFGIGVEYAGNFEGVDGSGKWWAGDVFGRHRPTNAQIEAGRLLTPLIQEELEEMGAELYGIAPHRYAAKDRAICPGSRIWSEAGEWSAREFDLRLPKPGPSIFRGCQDAPDSWHGPHWQDGEGLKWLE